ncbi:MAG TPA: hypothetical protein VL966_15645 [Alphaproteobacteria bacterium]|nr:hypothetical protein [Alphaproteobacteria bacterium]
MHRLALFACVAATLAAFSGIPARSQDEAASPLPFAVELRDADPITLYDDQLEMSDSNTPVHWSNGRAYVFVSHWLPIGHSYRRSGTDIKSLEAGGIQVTIDDDKTPGVGKWIEATFRDDDGTLYGWYHAETDGPCGRPDAKVPVIGAMVSHNDGLTWSDFGPIIAAPDDTTDCDMQNGFFAGGLGDFSVIADHDHGYFYFFFSNYERHFRQQGIAIARMPFDARTNPVDQVFKWRDDAWTEPGLGGRTTPIFRAARNFRYADPDSFWGPAIHYNTYLGGYVMLLNHTAEGDSDWYQQGIYLTFSKDLADPTIWIAPQEIMAGGEWYPQVIGLAPGDTDTRSGRRGRFFMSGYSAWEIIFDKQPAQATEAH